MSKVKLEGASFGEGFHTTEELAERCSMFVNVCRLSLIGVLLCFAVPVPHSAHGGALLGDDLRSPQGLDNNATTSNIVCKRLHQVT